MPAPLATRHSSDQSYFLPGWGSPEPGLSPCSSAPRALTWSPHLAPDMEMLSGTFERMNEAWGRALGQEAREEKGPSLEGGAGCGLGQGPREGEDGWPWPACIPRLWVSLAGVD